jgi:hypothetical protein
MSMMDGMKLDRVTRAFARSSARRQAVRATVLSAVAALAGSASRDANAAGAMGRKRCKTCCKKLLKTCDSARACCGQQFDVVGCAKQAAVPEKGDCAELFPGRRCCGLEGTPCNTPFGNCACCGALVCVPDDQGVNRCLPSAP